MTRVKLVFAAAVAVALLAVPTAFAKTTLKGSVGPGFTISLKTMSGKVVKTLKPGIYAIKVSDKSTIHDFHLKGPGVNKVITSVGFQGTKTFTVRLKKGRFTYVCDPHSSSMKGSFTVR
jgi:Copper binding proteins, plastocyanin/azurin family